MGGIAGRSGCVCVCICGGTCGGTCHNGACDENGAGVGVGVGAGGKTGAWLGCTERMVGASASEN
jgi:hypothetical protein